jgi:hypothetical protein
MHKLKLILNFENRNMLYQLYRTIPLMAHPELKIPKSKESSTIFIYMRDLSKWINEYAPLSSKSLKYNIEVCI